MVLKALRYIGYGIILIAASLFFLEFWMSNYDFPPVSTLKWIALAVAILLIVFARPHEGEVIEQHLPH
jgi:hypothetical protein